MTVSWSAIDCQELHNSRREWMDSDGKFRAFVKLMCAYEDRYLLMQDLYCSNLGPTLASDRVGYHPRSWPNTSTASPGGQFNAPVMSKIGVDSVTITTMPERYTGFTGSEDTIMEYCSTAYLDVQYGRTHNITEKIEFDSEFITQTWRDFKWKTKATEKDLKFVEELEAPGALINTMILTRDFVGLAPGGQQVSYAPNFSTLSQCIGFTNEKEYTSNQLQMTFKPGTLLMLEPDVRPSTNMQDYGVVGEGSNVNNFGNFGWAVTAKFLYRPGAPKVGTLDTEIDTHNIFWRARMKKKGSNKRGGWDGLEVRMEGAEYEDFEPFERSSVINNNWLIKGESPAIAE